MSRSPPPNSPPASQADPHARDADVGPGARGRILFDITYTRLQHGTVGITRTVRSLEQQLAGLAAAANLDFLPVAFDGRGFRAAPRVERESAGEIPAIWRLITGAGKSAIEALLALPWPLVRPLWKFASSRAFASRAGGLQDLDPGPGDALLLFDAGWNYPLWAAARRARANGAVVVPLVHDLMPLQAPQYCVPWVRRAFADWLEQAVHGSDLILCNSANTKLALTDYAQRKGWQTPPIGVIRLGSEPPQDLPGTVRSHLRAFLLEGDCYTTVGSLEPKKNHGLLIDAFEPLWQAGEFAPLLIIGRETPECEAVARRIENCSRAGHPLLWIKDASDFELAFAYTHSRALVLPSLFEGFGLPLVEARVRGCPVFASDIPAFRELQDSGVHLFDATSAPELGRLLRRHRAGELNLPRTAMDGFTWEACACECLKYLDSIVARSPASAGSIARPGTKQQQQRTS